MLARIMEPDDSVDQSVGRFTALRFLTSQRALECLQFGDPHRVCQRFVEFYPARHLRGKGRASLRLPALSTFNTLVLYVGPTRFN